MSEAINEDGFMVECDIADDDYSISTNLKNRSAFFIQTLNAFFEKIGSTSINMELVSQAIKRYQLYSDYLCANIATIEKISEHNDTDKTTSLSIVSMILTGSLLEATIVFFLLAYLDEYSKDSKYHWVLKDGSDVDIPALKDSLLSHLDSLVYDGKITLKQKNSLKSAINEKLRPHEDWKEITKLSFDNLIDFCKDNSLFETRNNNQDHENEKTVEGSPQHVVIVTSNPSDPSFQLLYESLDSHNYQLFDNTSIMSQEDIISAMKEIQKSRNNVHIFTSSPTTDSCKTLKCISLLCRIINDLSGRIFMKTNTEVFNSD